MAAHQTVHLSRGKHRSPAHGVCAMELASMLADEPFSDHPRSVSPVIGAFVRAYNDGVDDERRQDLYAYASRIVGTAASRGVERSRVKVCVRWLAGRGDRIPFLMRWFPGASGAVSHAGRIAAADPGPAAREDALSLLDSLIELGDSWVGVPSDAGELVRPDAAAAGSEARY